MPRRVSDDDLRQAARLRAEGRSWDGVAAELQRSASTLRKWPREHGGAWRRHFQASMRERRHDADAEAEAALRNLLRDKEDKKLVKDAATAILRHRATPRAGRMGRGRNMTIDANVLALASHVAGLSDAELEAECREMLNGE